MLLPKQFQSFYEVTKDKKWLSISDKMSKQSGKQLVLKQKPDLPRFYLLTTSGSP